MTKSYHIPTPCSEDWNKMKPNEQGRHCEKCALTVIDFTQMTEAEIIQTLEARSGQRTCGRIRQEVRDLNLPSVTILGTQGFRLPNIASSIYTLSIAALLLASCQNSTTTTGEIDPVEQEHPLGEPMVDTSGIDSIDAPKIAKDSSGIPVKPPKKHERKFIDLTGDVVVGEPPTEPDPLYNPDEITLPKEIIREDTLSIVEKYPEFPGGQDCLIEFINRNLVYPEQEKKAQIEGRIIASFVIDPQGKILNIQIVRSVKDAPNFDAEAIRVLRMMPDWIPGEDYQGRKCYVRYTLPVRFKLN